MSKTISLIQRVEIASPCPAKWDDMVGDERLRFCSQCQLNVYNLSAMSEAEAEGLIIQKEGRLCARIYRRADGTVITRDCPAGLRAIRRRVVGFGIKIAAAAAFLLSVAAHAALHSRNRDRDAFFDEMGWSYSSYSQVRDAMEFWLETNPQRFMITGAMVVHPPN
jgi:hypothetical protein